MMKHLLLICFTLTLAATAMLTSSCKKKQFSSSGNLAFSADTIVFDTVFTTIGSTTQLFKVYNNDNKKLLIEEIELVGGTASPFRINFDGLQGTSFSDIEIEAKDSLFCFVEVTLSVNGGVLPMVVEDSIRFRTNGVDQYVKLVVWGQDAYFHYKDVNSGTWPNDKPHVIYGYAAVDEGQTLDIPAGTDVYLHKNSFLYVYRGTLNVNGAPGNEVTFQGDRLEAFYDDVAGQYYGIYLDSARPSTISYAKIKNAITGIHIESKDPSVTGTTLTLKNTEIGNCASYGMLFFDRPKVEVENTLIHSSGVHALIVLQGAEFTFTHCDLLGFGPGDGTTPAVGISNHFTQNGVMTVTSIPTGDFNNCLIYGYQEEQLAFDTIVDVGVTLNFNFRNCRIARVQNTNSGIFQNCFFSGNPYLVNPSDDDYHRYQASGNNILDNNGSSAYATPFDITGTTPRGNPPDIGAYEVP